MSRLVYFNKEVVIKDSQRQRQAAFNFEMATLDAEDHLSDMEDCTQFIGLVHNIIYRKGMKVN